MKNKSIPLQSRFFRFTPCLMTWVVAWAFIATPVCADIYVVVAVTNPLRSVTLKELQSFYMGRNRVLTNGELVSVYDLPRDNPTRDDFYQALTGMGQAHINSYWSRLMFTGQIMPPQSLGSEQTMLEQIKRGANAIGYLSKEPVDMALRTILVIKPNAGS